MKEKKETEVATASAAAGLEMDVCRPREVDAIHSVALGEPADYRSLARVKVAVDKCFNEVQLGRLAPLAAMRCLREEVMHILAKY